MKSIILSLLMLTAVKLTGQGLPPTLVKNWTTVKAALHSRNVAILKLSSGLSKTPDFKKDSLENLNNKITAFDKSITSTRLDSASLSVLYSKENEIIPPYLALQLAVEKNKKLQAKKEIADLLLQIESSEHRIVIAKKVYNDYCIETNRSGLQFGAGESSAATSVEF